MVLVARFDVTDRELVHLAIAEQHFIHGLATQMRCLGQQFFRPDFFDLEALGELHDLPQVRASLTGGFNQLVPEVRTTFRIAVSAFFFHPHGCRQNQVSRHGSHCRVGIRDLMKFSGLR